MKPMERFLTADEMARLNPVLARDEFWCPHIVAIVRKPSGRKTVRIYLKARIAALPGTPCRGAPGRGGGEVGALIARAMDGTPPPGARRDRRRRSMHQCNLFLTRNSRLYNRLTMIYYEMSLSAGAATAATGH